MLVRLLNAVILFISISWCSYRFNIWQKRLKDKLKFETSKSKLILKTKLNIFKENLKNVWNKIAYEKWIICDLLSLFADQREK